MREAANNSPHGCGPSPPAPRRPRHIRARVGEPLTRGTLAALRDRRPSVATFLESRCSSAAWVCCSLHHLMRCWPARNAACLSSHAFNPVSRCLNGLLGGRLARMARGGPGRRLYPLRGRPLRSPKCPSPWKRDLFLFIWPRSERLQSGARRSEMSSESLLEDRARRGACCAANAESAWWPGEEALGPVSGRD